MNHLHFKELHLKNFATFVDQRVQFDPHFNCIIGETGSGKSLLADAIQIILGSRGDKSYIRKHTDFCVLEAELLCEDASVIQYLTNKGFPCENNSIYIKRIINAEGPSKSYINGSYCSSQILKDFSKRHIDLVGQFHNQKLLSPNYQLKLIDNFVKTDTLTKYNKEFSTFIDLKNEKEGLEKEFTQFTEQESFFRFQLTELEEIQNLISNEGTLLKEKDAILLKQSNVKNREELKHLLVNEAGNGLDQALARLTKLVQTEDKLNQKYHNSLSQFQSVLNDLSFDVNQEDDNFDEAELDRVLGDLDSIQKLKRKHKCEAVELITKYKSLKNNLNNIDQFHERLDKIDLLIKNQNNICKKLAGQLHKKRVLAANDIGKQLNKMLAELNMKGCTVNLNLDLLEELTQNGLSKLEFLIETNPGEGFHSLSKIASGGELSRILLCLRRAVASKDSISIFFFDEIDTGIGGNTAKKIGRALASIAEPGQVIAITHLPQIAQYANLLVDVKKTHQKSENKLRTVSEIEIFGQEHLQQKVREMVPLDI